MSVFPDTKHLYDDIYYGSAGLVLDARDRLKTRELNAREKRHLDQQMCVLDRAKDVCARSRNWEHHHLRDHLGNIASRTPAFNQRLIEKVRKVVLTNTIATEANTVSGHLTVSHVDKQSYHDIVGLKSPYIQQSPLWYSEAHSVGHKRPGTDIDPLTCVSNSYRRRSDHVVKALARLYIRSDKRRALLADKSSIQEAEPDSFHYRSYMALKSTEEARLTEENLQAFLDAQSNDETD